MATALDFFIKTDFFGKRHLIEIEEFARKSVAENLNIEFESNVTKIIFRPDKTVLISNEFDSSLDVVLKFDAFLWRLKEDILKDTEFDDSH